MAINKASISSSPLHGKKDFKQINHLKNLKESQVKNRCGSHFHLIPILYFANFNQANYYTVRFKNNLAQTGLDFLFQLLTTTI